MRSKGKFSGQLFVPGRWLCGPRPALHRAALPGRAAAGQVGGGTEAAVFKWVTRKGGGGIWSRCVAAPGAWRLLRSFCGGDQLDISCGLRGPFPSLAPHPSCRWSAAETRQEEADHCVCVCVCLLTNLPSPSAAHFFPLAVLSIKPLQLSGLPAASSKRVAPPCVLVSAGQD